MNDDKMIADYIKERMPEILNTYDFAIYKFSRSMLYLKKNTTLYI